MDHPGSLAIVQHFSALHPQQFPPSTQVPPLPPHPERRKYAGDTHRHTVCQFASKRPSGSHGIKQYRLRLGGTRVLLWSGLFFSHSIPPLSISLDSGRSQQTFSQPPSRNSLPIPRYHSISPPCRAQTAQPFSPSIRLSSGTSTPRTPLTTFQRPYILTLTRTGRLDPVESTKFAQSRPGATLHSRVRLSCLLPYLLVETTRANTFVTFWIVTRSGSEMTAKFFIRSVVISHTCSQPMET